jgi:hypothetical protein
MATRHDLLQSHRWETHFLQPDKWVHLLTAEQAGGSPTPISYKQSSEPNAELGRGGFGFVRLENADSAFGCAPRVRAVKGISKRNTIESQIDWRHEVENLTLLSKVRLFYQGKREG